MNEWMNASDWGKAFEKKKKKSSMTLLCVITDYAMANNKS